MTRPRKELVSLSDTPYYHIVSRCVRRTFLCGHDKQSGQSFDHRRQWIINRIRLLSSIFSIDIAAYAVMSNHYHIVVKLCPEQAESWSNNDVIERWTSLFKGPLLVQKYRSSDSLNKAELATLNDIVSTWRNRLTDLGWFMKCLNEPIARAANKEDQCTGHFWEARYKSQALLSDEALIACMAYVDLNPIRANIAKTPEASDFTSVKERIKPTFNLATSIQEEIAQEALKHFETPLKSLLAFDQSIQQGIPCRLVDYLELVDWTGRVVRNDKKGTIAAHIPPILQRLSVTSADWLLTTQNFEKVHARKLLNRCKRKKIA